MKLREVEYDPIFNITRKVWFDGDGGIYFQSEQQVSDLVDENKGNYAAVDEHARWGGDGDNWGRRVASIPLVLWFELEKQGITKDEKALKKWLNDNENRFFRTRPGRV